MSNTEESQNERVERVISKNTPVQIGLVVLLLGGVFGHMKYLDHQFLEVSKDIGRVEDTVDDQFQGLNSRLSRMEWASDSRQELLSSLSLRQSAHESSDGHPKVISAIHDLEQEMERRTVDRWTKDDMELWVEKFSRALRESGVAVDIPRVGGN